jgi:hypothetical protein
MDSQSNDFQEKYAKYAPAGATIKKNWAWNHSFRTRLLRNSSWTKFS